VRRNAVLCIYTIYKNYDFLMPDAPEVIQQFLMQEQVRNSIEQKTRSLILLEVFVEELLRAVAHRPFTHLSNCVAQLSSGA
jgi:coatomer subunit beta